MQLPIRQLIVVIVVLTCVAGKATGQVELLKQGQDLLGGFGEKKTGGEQLSKAEIGAGLKEALRVGTTNVVGQLGQVDGFNADPAIHISLPDNFKTVQSTLHKLGMSSMLDDLELRLNRAAEVATPKAKELFWQSITEMTLEDVQAIYTGPDDAATRYFQGKMSKPLGDAMRPIVDDSLAEVGAVAAFDNVMTQYRAVPFVPDVKADLTNHVLDKGIDGIFHYLAMEETAIRQDPAKRTTELLKLVFGGS